MDPRQFAAALVLLPGMLFAHPTAPATIAAHNRDSGHTLRMHVHDHLVVVLTSTYWTVQGSSNTRVLRQTGHSKVEPRRAGCGPGQGCGTVTTGFEALAPGRAEVTASRTTCGEAMRCTGSAGSYRVRIVVVPSGGRGQAPSPPHGS
jgi:hypothetical protein